MERRIVTGKYIASLVPLRSIDSFYVRFFDKKNQETCFFPRTANNGMYDLFAKTVQMFEERISFNGVLIPKILVDNNDNLQGYSLNCQGLVSYDKLLGLPFVEKKIIEMFKDLSITLRSMHLADLILSFVDFKNLYLKPSSGKSFIHIFDYYKSVSKLNKNEKAAYFNVDRVFMLHLAISFFLGKDLLSSSLEEYEKDMKECSSLRILKLYYHLIRTANVRELYPYFDQINFPEYNSKVLKPD